MKARLSGDAKALAGVTGEFKASTCDPAWATTIEEYLQYFGPGGSQKQIPYIRASSIGPRTIEFKADARVALVGDWGTGAQPAVQVLKQIATWKPDILIHLGDIYYSGTADGMPFQVRGPRSTSVFDRTNSNAAGLHTCRQSRHVLRRRGLLRSHPTFKSGDRSSRHR